MGMQARSTTPGRVIGSEDDYAAFARTALPWYGFGADAVLTLLSLSENGTYLASDAHRRLVLRVHRPGYHDRRAIESELHWMESVREECGIPTPVVVPSLDGSLVLTVEHAGRTREVDAVSVVDGRTGEDTEHPVPYAELGRISALLHAHSARWRPPQGFERFRWDFPHSLGDAARWGHWADAPGIVPGDHALLSAATDAVEESLRSYGTGADRFGLIHADLRMSNIMVGPDGAVTVIDFDDCGYGWYLSDLASVISWEEHHDHSRQAILDWLRGYLPHRALAEDDLAMIPAFVMMRRLMLTAWLGSHPGSPPARMLGSDYARGTVALAVRYLDDAGWHRYTLADLRPATS